jgi:hypothetical protein
MNVVNTRTVKFVIQTPVKVFTRSERASARVAVSQRIFTPKASAGRVGAVNTTPSNVGARSVPARKLAVINAVARCHDRSPTSIIACEADWQITMLRISPGVCMNR